MPFLHKSAELALGGDRSLEGKTPVLRLTRLVDIYCVA
jgi:hypothetical protein